jgi:hypothetical protein
MHILENKAYLMFAERDPPEEKKPSATTTSPHLATETRAWLF